MSKKTGLLYSLRSRGFDRSTVRPFTRSAYVACSQCQALVINGHPTHEGGCPNTPIPTRTGCMERVCTCHDDRGWQYPGSYPAGCSSCGCHR